MAPNLEKNKLRRFNFKVHLRLKKFNVTHDSTQVNLTKTLLHLKI